MTNRDFQFITTLAAIGRVQPISPTVLLIKINALYVSFSIIT